MYSLAIAESAALALKIQEEWVCFTRKLVEKLLLTNQMFNFTMLKTANERARLRGIAPGVTE
ncbi:hypothetical protein QYH69_27860 [Paraburkholderia sp. SARCC-3016]|uniref:hypothetical protein n=1 Tax=Paraburkholderia sp. SARCC-3016 TaxID=3058611 RepID=UPI00280854E5|nr:hypothetical protein [Paraburkholderia sp. SARCC-3016]MDQ7981057.1 hypothetical protein [Paraburkholderia sp. SARCC-3016]